MRVWEATVRTLLDTGNPAVMWGDEGLLHLIADRLGWERQGHRTSDRVLNALAKTPGWMQPRKASVPTSRGDRQVRYFGLPDDVFICRTCDRLCREVDGSWDGPEHSSHGFQCYDCIDA